MTRNRPIMLVLIVLALKSMELEYAIIIKYLVGFGNENSSIACLYFDS